MKLKVLKNHHWPPDWDFVANDTKNLAQKESRVRLPDQSWQRKLIWLPLEPVSKGSWPHYALCLLWKSSGSTAYSALKGPGLQSQLVGSGLQGTEEPTDSGENIKGIYHPAEQSVWKQGQFRNGSKISTEPLRPQILCIFLFVLLRPWVLSSGFFLGDDKMAASVPANSVFTESLQNADERQIFHASLFILEEDLSQNVLVEWPSGP